MLAAQRGREAAGDEAADWIAQEALDPRPYRDWLELFSA